MNHLLKGTKLSDLFRADKYLVGSGFRTFRKFGSFPGPKKGFGSAIHILASGIP